MSQIIKNGNREITIDNIPHDLIFKSLIIVDMMGETKIDNRILTWNNIVLQKTSNLKNVGAHIHIFSETELTNNNAELENHAISKDQLLFEMLLLIAKINDISRNVVIISLDNFVLSQLQRAEEVFNERFIFIKRTL